jgi:drug/metabolite transporter (DMT)-like permease
MMNATTQSVGGPHWLLFVLMTVAMWGMYGICLHAGQVGMADPVSGRYKAFLMVGIAYFLTAVLAPLAILLLQGASWNFPVRGVAWSVVAGLVGAGGAFCVLLAFGARGTPATVMTLVFAGAPVVNAIVALSLHPPHGGLRGIPKPFFLGLILAIVGSALVTLYKPKPGPGRRVTAAPQAHATTPEPLP